MLADAGWWQVEERAKYGQVFETLRPVDGRLHGDKVRPVSSPDGDCACTFLAFVTMVSII